MVEALTDEELSSKAAEVQQITDQLRERESAYQELEAQTALVIGERDDMWSKVDELSAEKVRLQSDLDNSHTEKARTSTGTTNGPGQPG